jgi:hypothetical protein
MLAIGIAISLFLAGCGPVVSAQGIPVDKPYPCTWHQLYIDGMCVPYPNQEWDKYPVTF